MEDLKRIFAIVLNIIIPVAVSILFLTLGLRLIFFFLPFIAAYVISLIANPMVNFLEKHIKLKRKHSSMLFVAAVLAIIILMLYLIALGAVYAFERFLAILPGMLESVRSEINNLNLKIKDIINFMPENTSSRILGINETIISNFEKIAGNLAAPGLRVAGNIVLKIPNALFYIIVILVASYIFIVERDRINTFLKKHMSGSLNKYLGYVKRDLKKLVGGYFFAQFKIMLYMMILLSAGLLILGNKYAVIWAILIGIFDFLPIFGAGAILIPWGIIKLFTGAYIYGIGLILLYIITQIIKNIIQPKIVGESFGLHGMVTLIAVFIGFKIRGIGGMIIAIPMALMLIKVYQYGIYDNLIKNIVFLYEEVEKFRKKYE